MAIINEKHLRISDTETGNAADDLNENFQELAARTGMIVRVSPTGSYQTNGGTSPFKYNAYEPTANTDAARGTALKAAIDAAGDGDTIFVAPGVYAVGADITALPDNFTIIGSGNGTYIDRGSGNNLVNANTIGPVGITIRDCRIRGRIWIGKSIRCTFQNLTFEDSTTNDHILISDNSTTNNSSYGHKFIDCYFGNAARSCIYLNDVDRSEIRGCIFENTTGTGVYVERGGAASTDTTQWSGIIISSCSFRNSDEYGIVLDGHHDPIVSACNFENNSDGGVYVKGPIQTTITGCFFERNDNNANSAGVKVGIVNANNLGQINQNEGQAVVSCCNFGLEKTGVWINTETAGNRCQVSVIGNYFYGDDESAGATGIKVTGYVTGSPISIKGNTFMAGELTPTNAISVAGTSTTAADEVKITENDIDGYTTGVIVDGLTDVLARNNDATNTTTAQSLLNSGTVRTS